MAVLRIPTSLLWALAALVVLLLIVFVFVTLHKTSTAVSSSLPPSIQYALEYFNAARQNSTLLVPSQYYTAARDYSINGNNVIENNSLYYSILFGNTPLPKGYNILIDMSNLSGLSGLINFPYNFTTKNLSGSLRNCQVAGSKIDAFAVCAIYSNVSVPAFNKTINKTLTLGFGTFVAFPNTSALSEINATIAYNGQNRTYIKSVRINGTAFADGIMFLYENTAAFYVPPGALNTFYGREIFLPNSTLKNVVDNFFTARIIS